MFIEFKQLLKNFCRKKATKKEQSLKIASKGIFLSKSKYIRERITWVFQKPGNADKTNTVRSGERS